MASVAEHGGSVGERLDLVHAVRDVEDGDALGFESREHRIDLLHVGAGESRGGLVEDQELRPLAERLGDLDHLAPRQRQVAHPHQRVDVRAADLGQQGLGAAALRPGIDEAEAPRRRSDRDIVRDREVGHQRQLLEDAHDAGRVGGGWRGEADIVSGKAHAAGIGLDHAGDDLDQRRLAGTVLAQHRMDLAALAGEVDALEGAYAAIALGDAGQCEEGALRRDSILHGAGSGSDGLADARP